MQQGLAACSCLKWGDQELPPGPMHKRDAYMTLLVLAATIVFVAREAGCF